MKIFLKSLKINTKNFRRIIILDNNLKKSEDSMFTIFINLTV